MVIYTQAAVDLSHKFGVDYTEISTSRDNIVGREEVIRHMDQFNATHKFYNPQRFSLIRKIHLRKYQQEACDTCTIDGTTINSGIIVMPCGSGKTMVGAEICTRIGLQCLIVTTRQPQQWRDTFLKTYHCNACHIQILGQNNSTMELSPIVITTYSMLCTRGFHPLLTLLKHTEMGTLILDEVHTSAAQQYMTHLKKRISARYCIGLTATPLREDDEFGKVIEYIGKTLCSVEKESLVKQGYLASVTCFAYSVPISKRLSHRGGRVADLNPIKMDLVEILLRQLLEHKRNTLVFCDDIQCLHISCEFLRRNGLPIPDPVHMKTKEIARQQAYKTFNDSKNGSILAISRVGDDALDLPDASAMIIIWNRWKSRRQIMQRIGRISRPGRPALVIIVLSNYAKELNVHKYRQKYLAEQNYTLITQNVTNTVYANMLQSREASISSREDALLSYFKTDKSKPDLHEEDANDKASRTSKKM
jgi:DNA excision repair protein ERCC-3